MIEIAMQEIITLLSGKITLHRSRYSYLVIPLFWTEVDRFYGVPEI